MAGQHSVLTASILPRGDIDESLDVPEFLGLADMFSMPCTTKETTATLLTIATTLRCGGSFWSTNLKREKL